CGHAGGDGDVGFDCAGQPASLAATPLPSAPDPSGQGAGAATIDVGEIAPEARGRRHRMTDTLDLSRYKLGWSDEEDYVFKPKRGLDLDIVQEMSWMKGEPDWMRDFRLKSLRHFDKRPMPSWGGDMSGIDFSDIYYYIKPTDSQVDAWDE